HHFDDSMTQDIWRLVTPQYDQFNAEFSQYPSLPPVSLFGTQTRLSQAIERFIHINGFSRVLLINAPDNSIYRSLIKEEMDSLVTTVPVVVTETLNMVTIFGRLKPKMAKSSMRQADYWTKQTMVILLFPRTFYWPILPLGQC